MPFFFDWTMILLIPAAVFALFAQQRVKSTYAKYLNVPVANGRSGRDIAESLLAANGIHDVRVVPGQGFLGDFYHPVKKVVSLSPHNYEGSSVAATAVAAHEVGHAIQHAKRYAPLQWRHSILPVSNIGSTLAFPLFIGGMLIPSLGVLMDVGIALFALAVVAQVVTLPVEFDASRRALEQVKARGMLTAGELDGGKRVLTAAALTYVAATAVALTHLIRLLILRNARD